MKLVKRLRGWGIFENNSKEVEEYGFNYTILSPDDMEYRYLCSPSNTDMEFDVLEAAVYWVEHY